jgi:hypothetical protein
MPQPISSQRRLSLHDRPPRRLFSTREVRSKGQPDKLYCTAIVPYSHHTQPLDTSTDFHLHLIILLKYLQPYKSASSNDKYEHLNQGTSTTKKNLAFEAHSNI